jgi:hypothetical protein
VLPIRLLSRGSQVRAKPGARLDSVGPSRMDATGVTGLLHQWVVAKMRLTFSSEKNSAGETTPEKTRANPSLASRLPDTASSTCCISGGGGCMDAN